MFLQGGFLPCHLATRIANIELNGSGPRLERSPTLPKSIAIANGETRYLDLWDLLNEEYPNGLSSLQQTGQVVRLAADQGRNLGAAEFSFSCYIRDTATGNATWTLTGVAGLDLGTPSEIELNTWPIPMQVKAQNDIVQFHSGELKRTILIQTLRAIKPGAEYVEFALRASHTGGAARTIQIQYARAGYKILAGLTQLP